MKQLMIKGLFADSSPMRKFFVSFFMIIFCSLLFMCIGLLVMSQISDSVISLKVYQLISATGTFCIAPLSACYLISHSCKDYLSLYKTKAIFYPIAVLIVLVAIPFINFTTLLNEQIELPESWQFLEAWIKEMEEKNGDITQQFLDVSNFGEYLFNILVLALIPAIGEELLFRGFIQKALQKHTKNIHIAIWCSAILFSAIHCQFYGFFPRMFMGIIFGYLLYWSGSIFVPMACHFFNNAVIVTCSYFIEENEENIAETLGKEDLLLCLLSLALIIGGCYIVKRISNTSIPHEETSKEI